MTTVGSVVRAYLDEQYAAFLAGVEAVRGELDDDGAAIHATRVAVRRYRTVLRSYSSLLDPDRAAHLDVELAWFAGVLGAVRDTDVLRAHLAKALARLAPELVIGDAAATIDRQLNSDKFNARRDVEAALRTGRFQALLAGLADWHGAVPFTAAADASAETMKSFVQEAERTVVERLKKAARNHAPDELVHRARKSGKRARYAAEVATPVLGKRVQRTIKQAEKLQDVLGLHQDCVVAAQFLLRLATLATDTADGSAFTFGLLYADEVERAGAARRTARTFRF